MVPFAPDKMNPEPFGSGSYRLYSYPIKVLSLPESLGRVGRDPY